MAYELDCYIKLTGVLRCRTGLRIGGNKEDLEIGGMDNPIIRHPVTKHPYIPGSSLKGKLRSLLEYKYGKVQKDGQPCGCAKADCPICPLFGPHLQSRQSHSLGPTRILLRDAMIRQTSIEWLEPMMEEGSQFAEIKTENIIDRSTGRAADRGLRTQERVPAGTEFDFELVLRVFKGDDKQKMLSYITEGLRLLEMDYLGSSGSRGYGQVEIEELGKVEIQGLQQDGQHIPNWREEGLA